jgi:hypothetical protein
LERTRSELPDEREQPIDPRDPGDPPRKSALVRKPSGISGASGERSGLRAASRGAVDARRGDPSKASETVSGDDELEARPPDIAERFESLFSSGETGYEVGV